MPKRKIKTSEFPAVIAAGKFVANQMKHHMELMKDEPLKENFSKKEIEQMVKALKFYAEGHHYRISITGDDVLSEYGETAQKILDKLKIKYENY